MTELVVFLELARRSDVGGSSSHVNRIPLYVT